MEIITLELAGGGTVKVRIENGFLQEVTYYKEGKPKKTVGREQEADIKYWIKDTMKPDTEKFKELLSKLKADSEFYEYGYLLLESERTKMVERLAIMQKSHKKSEDEIRAEIKRYSFFKC